MTNERLQRTPLYEVAVAEGGRMAPFGGWEMPVQFEGIRSEHWAVRREAGLFDISHMGRIAVSGGLGLAFLDSLLPARVRELTIGQMLYAPLCNEQGWMRGRSGSVPTRTAGSTSWWSMRAVRLLTGSGLPRAQPGGRMWKSRI